MTVIWGIVNVTPDSFSDGGRYLDADRAVAHGLELRAQGADVLDIGGESTRPGAQRVSAEEEQRRVLPVIERLVAHGIPVSIDTLRASTAAAAVRAGVSFVNDVSGGLADPAMRAIVAESDADFAIGHWRGPSTDMYAHANYGRVAREVASELQQRVGEAAAAGIAPHRIIVDPGIGFAKTGAQNWEVLRGLDDIVALGSRVLIGTSRKRFLGDALRQAQGPKGGGSGRPDAGGGSGRLDARDGSGLPDAGDGSGRPAGGGVGPGAQAEEPSVARRDLATAVTSALAARAGVWAVRVHEVAATRDALMIAAAWEGR